MKRLIIIALPICFFVIFSCSKDLSVETGSASTSLGTLKNTSGDCSPIVVGGIYTEGQNLTAANYVDVTVTVTTPGKYKILTDTVNGYSFADSGFFTATGTFVVRLKGSGKAILPLTDNFTVAYGLSFCDFTNTVNASATSDPNDADTAWQFDEAAKHFHGYIDSAVLSSTTTLPVYLKIYGKTITNDTTFYVQLLQSSATPTGAYSTSTGTAVFEFKTPAGNTIYDARQSNSTNLTFTVTNFDATTRLLEGNFSGTAKDGTTSNVNISLGKLKVRVE